MLRELGATVAGLSISEPDNARHAYYALKVRENLINPGTAVGDVRSLETYRGLVDTIKPDYIFHLAAQAIVSVSYRDPLDTITSNVVGVANACEVLRTSDQSIISVIVTSDKCYKNKERMEPYLEDEEMGGDDPYSASKGAAELVFHSYMASYFTGKDAPIASARAGNVFGGGDWSPNRLVPDCMRDLLEDRAVTIRMPEAIRPWTYVLDILTGYMQLAAGLADSAAQYRGSWNIASGETRTVLEICNTLVDALGKGSVHVDAKAGIGKEAGLLLIDAQKAIQHLGWEPRQSLDAALRDTAEWYDRQAKGEDMYAYSAAYLREKY
ncbi:CDP-glucose 4,6-dehydratase [Caulobacter sp. BE254]|nr:CDP-glucose 4,6-dehydratase [Caulobacter sp. BE254]